MESSNSSPHQRPGRRLLKELLAERNQFPGRVAAIDEQIRRTFERKVAILVLDMCGFSQLTIEYGIIHYLAMIVQMEEAATPAIKGNHGQIMKQEADNIFAIFEQPDDALEAGLDLFRAFEAVNSVVPPERDIFGSIGIGYGDLLVIGEDDVFGAEMNLASKLGEDIAEKMEILLTPEAYHALTPGRYQCSAVNFQLNNLELPGYRFEKTLYPRRMPQGLKNSF